MGFESEFLAMMVQGIVIKPIASRDLYGAPVFGTSVTVPGHIEYDTKAIRRNVLEDDLSTAMVKIPPPNYIITSGSGSVTVPKVGIGDEVSLPDDGKLRHVLSAVIHDDDQGHHHQSLWLT